MATSFYAAFCALFYILLSMNVIRTRRRTFVALLDGQNIDLSRAIRAHGNFSEFAPIFLILLFISEFNGLSPFFIHIIGIIFVIGRLLHAYSLTKAEEYNEEGKLNRFPRFRFIGMIMTFTAIILTATILFLQYFFPFL